MALYIPKIRLFSHRIALKKLNLPRHNNTSSIPPVLLDFSPKCEDDLRARLMNDMQIYPDFVNPEEEKSLMEELELKFKRARYQFDHWDDVIISNYKFIFPHFF